MLRSWGFRRRGGYTQLQAPEQVIVRTASHACIGRVIFCANDADIVWDRPNFYSSPALTRSLDAALQASNLTAAEIEIYDFYSYVPLDLLCPAVSADGYIYSCFPNVPKLACRHLKLPMTGGSKPITLLGGLTSFGGAGNNYSMHVRPLDLPPSLHQLNIYPLIISTVSRSSLTTFTGHYRDRPRAA